MIRFTIRDMLWLTVVAAFAVFWVLERDGRITDMERIGTLYRENEALKKQVRDFEIRRRKEIIEAHQTVHELIQSMGITE